MIEGVQLLGIIRTTVPETSLIVRPVASLLITPYFVAKVRFSTI